MNKKLKAIPLTLFGNTEDTETPQEKKKTTKAKAGENDQFFPEKLGKAVRLPVPDFSDPSRNPTCLEVDFPIAQINALSNLEGNAGKPIYQMSKWWARRRSSVFRSMLIAAATEAPEDHSEAAKKVWDHYYCNHQKAASFKKLKVLDCFMGGGTTMVEGSRLGMQMTGVDLNPVAWFIVKNELACSDPKQVQALFDYIEAQVKPQIQPFYTTTCPRGHKGRWIDVQSGHEVDIDPIDLMPETRNRYRWEGPEIIYTFWAKHGPCQNKGCGHRTPIFRTPVIAEKKLSTYYIELICPNCGQTFHAELGETRMAPGVERIVLEGEPAFTETAQDFAQLLKDYDKGKSEDTIERMWALKERVNEEPGLCCPRCSAFAGKRLVNVLEEHAHPYTRVSQRKKKDFGIERKKIQMYLLIHPEWLKGASGFNNDKELGGWAGASAKETAPWHERRMENLALLEVRGQSLPGEVHLKGGEIFNNTQGTVFKDAHFTCGHCGRENKTLHAVKTTGHTAPVAAYALQCHCPICASQGYNYGGRYFKALDIDDIKLLNTSESEWERRSITDLKGYWPEQKIQYSHMTHERNPLPDHGYTHWWMLFNSRQLFVHARLLKAITEATENSWLLDIKEQALGTFQQYLRNQNMFCFYQHLRDHIIPHMSNANFNPKAQPCENNVFHASGQGNWASSKDKVIEGLRWAREPWEGIVLPEGSKSKSIRQKIDGQLIPGVDLYCGSASDLSLLGRQAHDLIITDPPFGNNLFYADLADFFYVWLRIPLQKWYAELPEQQYFLPDRTSHSIEAIDNSVEHPDVREEYEKAQFITMKHLKQIRDIAGDYAL